MSIPPQPYPAQYGSPRPTTVGPSARPAGILAVILGVLALGLGGSMIGMATQLVDVALSQNDPNMVRAIDQLAEMGHPPELIFYIMGGIFILAGIVMVVVGAILLTVRSPLGAILGLVVFIPITLFLLLNTLPVLIQGNVPALLMGLLLLAPNALVIHWLIQALRAKSQATPYPPVQMPLPTQPMQGYYHDPK